MDSVDLHQALRKRFGLWAEVPVNWVEELGTAIANEEVLPDGTSERGGYPLSANQCANGCLKSRLCRALA